MSRRGKAKKIPQKGGKIREVYEDDENEEEIDILNFPTQDNNNNNNNNDKWYMLLCASIVSTIYISTLFPSVPGGDSGELIISAYQMSIAHPPGYPLFTILGHLFTYLPYGSPAWRVNLMSALCGVFSSVFMYKTVARWSGNHIAGLLSAALFAFSPLIWTYTIQAEVFSLNNLLVNILLYLVVSYAQTRERKYVYLGSLVGGCGASNQHTIVFLFVPIVLWIFFIVGRKEFLYETRRWLILAQCALLGFLPYLHLLISPHIHQEKYSWGDTGSIGGFLHHFLRKEYGTFQLYSGNIADESAWLHRVQLYFSRLTAEVLYIGVPLAVVGLWASLKGKNKIVFSSVGYLIAFCFFFYVTVFYYLTNLPIQSSLHLGVLLRFFMQPNAIVCVWIGLGFAYLSNSLLSRGVPSFLPSLFVIIVAASQISLHYQEMDQHNNYVFYNYGKALLEPLPKDSILLAGGDLQTNVPYYLQLCEGLRPDVSILSVETMSWEWYNSRQGVLYPNVIFPGYVYHPFKKGGYSMKQFLDSNYKKRPIFLAGEWKVGDNSIEGQYTTAPYGLTGMVHPTNKAIDPFEQLAFSEKAMSVLNLTTWAPYSPSPKYGPETWEHLVYTNFWEAHEKQTNMFLIAGFERGDNAEKYLREAVKLLEFERDNRELKTKWVYKYLGAALDHIRFWSPTDKTIIPRVLEAWNVFLELGNDPAYPDPEYDKIRSAVERMKIEEK